MLLNNLNKKIKFLRNKIKIRKEINAPKKFDYFVKNKQQTKLRTLGHAKA